MNCNQGKKLMDKRQICAKVFNRKGASSEMKSRDRQRDRR